eukprot:TRINITY_DN44783_c0_g1_i1.p1 TRINITY_DN44783_c0_g1~~TRINITY_DN44783_c0_g1_i1.p1  ORF type:complete len:250 (+),score=80.24 TRINITY_DN44783_c0_g1_i1:109-858(+)
MSLDKAQRLVKDPNNLGWSRDSGRFGYQMLKQMGWKDGGGLGKTEDGSTSHLRVNHKVDMGGIGADKEEKALSVTTHTPAFEESLARLQQLYSAPTQPKTLVSMKHKDELERDRSRPGVGGMFIGRMVRHKRALDSKMVSTYSQKHLDEILGRKKEEEGLHVESPEMSQDSMDSEENDGKKSSGTIRKAGSIDDFFRKRGRLESEPHGTKEDIESLSHGSPVSDDENERRKYRRKKKKKEKRDKKRKTC